MRIVLAVISLALIFSQLPLPAEAAPRFGLEGGLNAAQFSENGISPPSDTHDWRQGLSAGVVLVLPWRPAASFVTGIRYERKGGIGEETLVFASTQGPRETSFNDRETLERRWTLDYVTIPFVLRVAKSTGIARPAFEFGPEVSVLVGGNVRYETLTGTAREQRERDITGDLNPIDPGMRMGIGLLIPDGPRLAFVRAGFVASFMNMRKAKSERTELATYGDLHAYNRAFVLSAGLIF